MLIILLTGLLGSASQKQGRVLEGLVYYFRLAGISTLRARARTG